MPETLSPTPAYEQPETPQQETGAEQEPSMQDVVKATIETDIGSGRRQVQEVMTKVEAAADKPEVSEQTRTQLKTLAKSVTAAVTQSRAQNAEVEDLPEGIAGQNSGERIAVGESLLTSGSTPEEVTANFRFVLEHELFHKKEGHTAIVGGETKEGTALIEGRTVKHTGEKADGGTMEVSGDYKGHVVTYDATERQVGKDAMEKAFKKKDLTGVLAA